MMVLKGLDVVFDCAVNSRRLTASAAEVRFRDLQGKVISFASEFVFNATRESVAI